MKKLESFLTAVRCNKHFVYASDLLLWIIVWTLTFCKLRGKAKKKKFFSVNGVIKQQVGIEVFFFPMFFNEPIKERERERERNLAYSFSFVWFSDASRPRGNAFLLLANARCATLGCNKKMPKG